MGTMLSRVKQLQEEKESISEAEQGKQVAMSMDSITIGRQIAGNEVLYSVIPENDFRQLKKLRQYLTKSEIEAIKEISDIMRKNNPVWGI
jgi:translation initiation factor 5B